MDQDWEPYLQVCNGMQNYSRRVSKLLNFRLLPAGVPLITSHKFKPQKNGLFSEHDFKVIIVRSIEAKVGTSLSKISQLKGGIRIAAGAKEHHLE